MTDYSGPFRADFKLEDLGHDRLAWYNREVQLSNHIHDRGIMSMIAIEYGAEAQTKVAIDEWMGSSPIYNFRNRQLMNMDGDDVATIFKGFQFDIGAPDTFLQFHYKLNSPKEGFFWLSHCGAYNHVRRMTNANPKSEIQICHHMEDPTFDATVIAVNQQARCTPVFRPPHSEVPAEGPCRWKVSIGDTLMLPEANPYTAIIGQSRAANFEFSAPQAGGEGLADYSGPFDPGFTQEKLQHGVLARQCREFALDVHLLQKACYASITDSFGATVAKSLAKRQWEAIAPVYTHRIRKAANIHGNDIEAILKLLQLDPFLPDEYLRYGVALCDDGNGVLWIEDCELLAETQPRAMLELLREGELGGLQAVVQAINPQAQVVAIAPAECVTAAGRAVSAWRILIDEKADPVQHSDYTAIVAGEDLWEHDASEHHYFYERYA